MQQEQEQEFVKINEKTKEENDAPKGPGNSYIYYCIDECARGQAEHPEPPPREVSKELEETKEETKEETDIIIILDESGSMSNLGDEPRQGINSFCEKQKEAGEYKVTIVTFNTDITTHCQRVDGKEFTGLAKFNPNGMTALHDAICVTINNFQKVVGDSEKDRKVIVLIVTDGEENSSREYDRHSTKDLITKMEKKGWLFVYLGANQDSITVSENIGIKHSANYRYDKEGCSEMFRETSIQLSRCISGDVPIKEFKSDEMRANLESQFPTHNVQDKPQPNSGMPCFLQRTYSA